MKTALVIIPSSIDFKLFVTIDTWFPPRYDLSCPSFKGDKFPGHRVFDGWYFVHELGYDLAQSSFGDGGNCGVQLNSGDVVYGEVSSVIWGGFRGVFIFGGLR
jgi:hypothetical protein